MSTHDNGTRWKVLISLVAFAVVGCAVAINAPRGRVVPANVVLQPKPAPRQVLAVVPGPRVPHEKHAELGLECTDCHEMDDAGKVSYPEVDLCLDCHTDLQDEEETPEAERIENVFFRDGKPQWRRALLGYHPDITFSHKPHSAANVECAACHGDMKGTSRIQKKLFDMAGCSACHTERGAPNECATCHRETRATVAPPSHRVSWESRHGPWLLDAERRGADPTCQYCHNDASFCNDCHQTRPPSSHQVDWERAHGQVIWQAGGPDQARCTFCHRDPSYCDGCHQNRKPSSHEHLWIRRHGILARAGDMSGMTRCTFCHHQPAFCEDCHLDMEPRDHTALFRTRTHGLMAALDRTRCTLCHETDFCVRCHESTPPRSHRGQWARGRNTHCLTCHYPIQSEPGCATCHRDTPTHDSAPPPPPTHNPNLNCRICHNTTGGGGAPPLRHVDNGMPCQLCHN